MPAKDIAGTWTTAQSGLWSGAVTEIAIRPLGEREFLVEVRGSGRQTTHRVTAPERLGGRLELRDEDLSEVVRQSFEFLLEREPASSILPQFSLDDISRYFPEYEQDVARWLG
jgi:hypothetical protein